MKIMKVRGAALPEEVTDFNKNFTCPDTFSGKDYFKTVHLGGDDVIKQMEDDLKREQDEWKAKVVVDNPVFTVNTRQPKSTN